MSPTRKSSARTRKKQQRRKREKFMALRFGRVLTRLRKSRKLSIEALSKKSGVPLPRITGLERGLRDPRIQDVFKIAPALGILPSQFLKRVDRLRPASASS